MSDHASVRSAYEALLSGEVASADTMIGGLSASASAGERAWALALRAARWHSEPAAVAMPQVAECAALAGDASAREALAIAAYHAARGSVLGFADATPWLELLGRVAPASVELAIAAALDGVLRGDVALASALAPDAELEANGATAFLRSDALSVGALAKDLSGDLPGALAYARAASRLSRSERLPQPQYLANVVLARLRRLHGLPHLAARILSALARVAPPQWAAWLSWELAIAGALDAAQALGSTRPTVSLFRFLEASSDGGYDAVRSAEAELLAASWWQPIFADASALVACSDPFVAPDGATEWVSGAVDVAPRGLWGLSAVIRPEEQGETALAVVLATPRDGARRMLWTGAGIARRNLDVAPLQQTKRKQGRMDSTIATLCLAGPEGIDDAELFHRVYRLRFVPHLHRGVLDVLLHRVRERLEGLGTLERREGRAAIRIERAILVPDPRCGRPIDDRLLYLLATGGHASAKDAARALEVPLRTAQAALQALVDDGSCVRNRRGNSVEYGVEDTTFSEPTRY